MINSIELFNWKSHLNTKIDLKKGTNIIIGRMGGGKSSLVDGISYAFFGTFPSLESRRIKINDLFRYNSDKITIKLSFEHKNKNYLIERTVEKKGKSNYADAKIYLEDNLVEKGQMAVNSFVSQLIGIDYDLFSRAVYSEQNNIDYFLTLNPKKRKEEFDALLGLDKFEIARANITTISNKFKNQRNSLENGFDHKKFENLNLSLIEKNSKMSEVEKKLSISKSALKEKNDLLKLIEKEIISLEQSKKLLKELKEKEIRANSIIENYKEELKKGQKKETEKISNELSKIKKEIDAQNEFFLKLRK